MALPHIHISNRLETYADGVNDEGQIVLSLESAESQEWLLTPKSTAVPEPSTWALMLLGFAGLGLAGYRGAPGTRQSAKCMSG